jgi:pyridoxine 5-phosphate synthase
MIRLGVNIDHVATVRQARRENFPSPVELALQACRAGAQGITAHLREDRRHIQDADIYLLKKKLPVPLNMEMAASASVVPVAMQVLPTWVCLVPEKRQELTTEGGLNLSLRSLFFRRLIKSLQDKKIRVSLFVDPTVKNMNIARALGADAVELHTGVYARCWARKRGVQTELNTVKAAARAAVRNNLLVNAGHGLDYENVAPLARVFPFHEFNIGFAIVAKALSVGMAAAVRDMKKRMAA